MLVSWESFADDGSTLLPLGDGALGQLMYTADGHVSAQLVRADQQVFGSDDWREATPAEMTAAWPNYFGYFGTYTIDADNAAITHHIESGWFPNLVGTKQLRHFRFDAQRLVARRRYVLGSRQDRLGASATLTCRAVALSRTSAARCVCA
ncbi:MAG TPA: lipocalin-like domain-containing protein [Mycobacterium sp.]|nr:lipocalin-like domain-containing protein [Mycobacterium sp.]